MREQSHAHRRPSVGVGGFTLIELLISMGILLILATLTMRLLNSTLDSDRLKAGARELQSYLAGARDRAIYAGQPRGVRFILDPPDPATGLRQTVSSFVYVGPPDQFTDGALLDIITANGAISFQSAATLVLWQGFSTRGLLPDGTQILLSTTTGPLGFATVAAIPGATPPTGFRLTSVSFLSVLPTTGLAYRLQLAPAVLQGEVPRSLPSRIAIDLNCSVLPASWGTTFTPVNPLDVLFSAQGTVVGAPASDGRIHFVFSDAADTIGKALIPTLPPRLQLNAPWQASTTYVVGNIVVPTPSNYVAFRCVIAATSGAAIPPAFATATPNQLVDDGVAGMWQCVSKRLNLVVSLATTTGRVTTHPVDVSTALVPGPGFDTYRFAEIGEVTQ